MPTGRRLSAEEAALWAKVASTVRAFERPCAPAAAEPTPPAAASGPPPPPGKQPPRVRTPQPSPGAPAPSQAARPLDGHTLDANWDRKLARGLVTPDFTLDLHGATLDSAYHRLDQGLALAATHGARLVLLITGRPRPQIDPADRAHRRGAIRAKFVDWLAQGRHAANIAAIRPAHPRHGGAGAVYIILRKPK